MAERNDLQRARSWGVAFRSELLDCPTCTAPQPPPCIGGIHGGRARHATVRPPSSGSTWSPGVARCHNVSAPRLTWMHATPCTVRPESGPVRHPGSASRIQYMHACTKQGSLGMGRTGFSRAGHLEVGWVRCPLPPQHRLSQGPPAKTITDAQCHMEARARYARPATCPGPGMAHARSQALTCCSPDPRAQGAHGMCMCCMS